MIAHAERIKKAIASSQRIALFGHMGPDGDCIWAMLWLGKLLEKQGKKIAYFTPTTPSKIFNFVPHIKKIKTTFDYKNYDLVIFVDFSGYKRLGKFTRENQEYFEKQNIVIIDHHPDMDMPKHALVMKDEKAMSTSEILFEHAQKRRKKYMDKEIATCFYLWLTMDSGNFVFDRDHERIFKNALWLIRFWANKTLVVNNLIRQKSRNTVEFLWLLIKRMKIHGHVLLSYYDAKELKKYDLDEEEAGYSLFIIQNIIGPLVTLFLRKEKGRIRWSLRAKDFIEGKNKQIVNCNHIAKLFGWWWHTWAAGFSLETTWSFTTQKNDIVAKINKAINKK